MKKYEVTTGWHETYEFDNGINAVNFAEMCLNHKADKSEDFSVTVKIYDDGEEEENENDNW